MNSPKRLRFATKNRRVLGDSLWDAINKDRREYLLPCVAQHEMVCRYLMGDRHFTIYNPWRPGEVVMQVDLQEDQPAWEALVSDVSQEVGRQLRMDPYPVASADLQTLDSLRNAAVANGCLPYLFPEWMVSRVHRSFQRLRVEAGMAGLAVTPCYRQGKWALEMEAVPPAEIGLLPVGVPNWEQVEGIVWQRWVSLQWLRTHLKYLGVEYGMERAFSLPSPDSEDYARMGVRSVTPGDWPGWGTGAGTTIGSATGGGYLNYSGGGSAGQEDGSKEGEGAGRYGSKMAEFFICYFTADQRHASRIVYMVGRHVVADLIYDDVSEQPLIPIGVGRYADVGSPRGRSFAFPRMLMTIAGERFLSNILRAAADVSTYGTTFVSSGMGVSLDSISKPVDGMRLATYTVDAQNPSGQPFQLMPINLAQVFGSLSDYVLKLSDTIFPMSPIFSGQSAGRVESGVAYRQLDILSNTQIAAGALSSAYAYAQVYAAGLDMARRHFTDEDVVPLLYYGDELAGVVLDVGSQPKSAREIEFTEKRSAELDATLGAQGIPPEQASLLRLSVGDRSVLAPEKGDPMPLPQFRIGPNVIPHPDTIRISVRSIMPRDQSLELQELRMQVQAGEMSMMEAQIEAYRRGLVLGTGHLPLGGRDIINAYQVAILNLLSAYGDGVEPGPILFPAVSRLGRVGNFVVQTFMESVRYLTASKAVQERIAQLSELYAPVNTSGLAMTPDEIGMAMDSTRMMQNQQLTPEALRSNPQLAAQLAGQMGGGM